MDPWAALAVGLVASVASAWVAYQVIERPAISLSRWATKPRQEQLIPQQAA
jgi:peptidoglycan/LPS O-acetylase OafA/YrhL